MKASVFFSCWYNSLWNDQNLSYLELYPDNFMLITSAYNVILLEVPKLDKAFQIKEYNVDTPLMGHKK